MYNRNLFLFPCLLFSINAHALSLSWAHEFADVTREHTDKFELNHSFENGLGVSTALEYSPRETEDGRSGQAFNHLKNKKKVFGIDYAINAPANFTLTPGLSFNLYDEKKTWKPGLEIRWDYNKSLAFVTRYRYEITDYDEKPTKHTHRIDIGAKYKIQPVTLIYKYARYFSDKPIYAKKDTDYKHEVAMKIKFFTHWKYVMEVSNESVAKNSERRQTVYTTGVEYAF